MATQELSDYIRSELQKGTALKLITSTLTAKGWSVQDIQEAITKAQQNTESTFIQTNNTRIDTQNKNQNPSPLAIFYVRLLAAFFILFPLILLVRDSLNLNFSSNNLIRDAFWGIISIGTGIGLLRRKSFFWYLATITSIVYLFFSLVLGIPESLLKLFITYSIKEIILPLLQILANILIVFLLIKTKRIFIIQEEKDSNKGKLKAAAWGFGLGIIPFILLMWIIWTAIKEPLEGMGGFVYTSLLSMGMFIFAVLGVGILVLIGKRKNFTSSQKLISILTYLLIIFSPLTVGLKPFIDPTSRAGLVRETQTKYQTKYLSEELSFKIVGEQINSQDRTIDITLKVNNTSGKILNVDIPEIRLATPDKIWAAPPMPYFADDINLVSELSFNRITFTQKNEEKFLLSPGETVLNFKLKITYDSNGVSIYNPQMDKQRAAEVAIFLASLSDVSVCGMLEIEGVRSTVKDYGHCNGAQYFGQTKPHDWLNLTY